MLLLLGMMLLHGHAAVLEFPDSMETLELGSRSIAVSSPVEVNKNADWKLLQSRLKALVEAFKSSETREKIQKGIVAFENRKYQSVRLSLLKQMAVLYADLKDHSEINTEAEAYYSDLRARFLDHSSEELIEKATPYLFTPSGFSFFNLIGELLFESGDFDRTQEVLAEARVFSTSQDAKDAAINQFFSNKAYSLAQKMKKPLSCTLSDNRLKLFTKTLNLGRDYRVYSNALDLGNRLFFVAEKGKSLFLGELDQKRRSRKVPLRLREFIAIEGDKEDWSSKQSSAKALQYEQGKMTFKTTISWHQFDSAGNLIVAEDQSGKKALNSFEKPNFPACAIQPSFLKATLRNALESEDVQLQISAAREVSPVLLKDTEIEQILLDQYMSSKNLELKVQVLVSKGKAYPMTLKEIWSEWIKEPSEFVKIGSTLQVQAVPFSQLQWFLATGQNPSRFRAEQYCPTRFVKIGDVGICPDLPVESVSWNDVQSMLKELNSGLKNVSFRLPTEEEWESFARAGVPRTQEYFFDANPSEAQIKQHTWYDQGAQTRPLGEKTPNSFSLFDLMGNVKQWTQDSYRANSKARVESEYRVVRGASFEDKLHSYRLDYRMKTEVGYRNQGLGFRLIRELH